MTEESLTTRILEIVRETLRPAGTGHLPDPGGAGLRSLASDPLAEGRLDSVAMVQLLAALEDGLSISIPAEEIRPENFASIGSLAHMVARLRSAGG